MNNPYLSYERVKFNALKQSGLLITFIVMFVNAFTEVDKV